MNEVLIAVITGIVSLIAGGSGVFVYFSNRDKTKLNAQELAVTEWKELYDEMRKRLDEQEEENKKLKNEIFELKESISKLNIDLQNYKKYDSYINELEKYIEHLLHTLKSLSTDEAYKNIKCKRPIKSVLKE